MHTGLLRRELCERQDKLLNDISKYLSDNNAVYIIGRDGKPIVSHNIYKKFKSASIIKLFILAYCIEYGEAIDEDYDIRPEDTVEYSDITELKLELATGKELLTLMIGSSDNTAANILINHIGFDTLNGYIKSRFDTDRTVINRLMMDFNAANEGRENYVSLNDAKNCLDICLSHPLGRKILSTQKCRDRIMRYIYKDLPFYGKAGEITGAYHDVGYIDGCFAGVLTEGMNAGEAAVLCGIAGLTAIGSERPKI